MQEENKLPVIVIKKKIDKLKLEKLAKKIKKYFEEEERYLGKTREQNENNYSRGFFTLY